MTHPRTRRRQRMSRHQRSARHIVQQQVKQRRRLHMIRHRLGDQCPEPARRPGPHQRPKTRLFRIRPHRGHHTPAGEVDLHIDPGTPGHPPTTVSIRHEITGGTTQIQRAVQTLRPHSIDRGRTANRARHTARRSP